MKTIPILNNFPLSDPQRTAALARGCDVAVTAGAGTGKTRTLVARYLALLADGLPLRQIVAVTFTRKAAREMRNRVRQEIGSYLRQTDLKSDESQKWQTYYNELDAARVGTIHNLCAEILRAHPAEAAIDPRFAVLDETQAVLLVEEALEATLAWAVESEELAPLFELLSERQLQELIAVLLGKRLVVQEVINGLPAETILSHWQDKLQEFQADAIERLLADPEFIAARRVLLYNEANNANDKAEGQRLMALAALDSLDGESLPGKLRDLAALDLINLVGGSQKSWPGGKEQLQEVKAALRCLRKLYRGRPLLGQHLNTQDETFAAAMPAIYALFQYAAQSYHALKEERDAVDFDDLEALAIQLLENHAPVRDYWQSQVQALLVDEFQDTNEHQCRFLRLLCPDGGKLFIVGDAKQSIYRFRGADVAVFAKEKEQIERQDGNLIALETSYRAHEPLLEGMNRLLRPILGDDLPGRPPWVAPFSPLKAGTTPVTHGLNAPFIEFHLTLGTKPEALPRAAAALAQRLAILHADHGLDYGDMAILCRASSSFQYYENAFDQAGIPYLTVAGKGFYNRPEIRDLLNALQALADPHDDLALTGLLRSPACSLSDVTLYRLGQMRAAKQSLWELLSKDVQLDDAEETARLHTAVSLIQNLHAQTGRTPAADILKQFLDRTHYRAILRRSGQLRALRNVAKLLNDIHGSELVSVVEFLEYAQTLRDSGSREGEARAMAGGALQIMSIHAAKGLEFPVIALGDAGSGSRRAGGISVDPRLGILLPYKNDEKEKAASYLMWSTLAEQQEEAETARLLYVALTRAEQMLFINGTVQQSKSGSISWKGWLKQLAEIVGLNGADLTAYDEMGSEQHTFDYTLQETAVRTTFYEPSFVTQKGSLAVEIIERPTERPSAWSLQKGVVVGEPFDTAVDDSTRRAWQVVPTAQKPTAPAWIIGQLVHEALAFWRFPGRGFDKWVYARARTFGLTDEQQLGDAQRVTSKLLKRFQKSELFREMGQATKWLPEVPYNYKHNSKVEMGYMDVLYQTAVGWTVVDFKTDQVRSAAALEKLLAEKDYEEQLRRYGLAVRRLLGVTPRLKLCLLDYGHKVYLHTVVIDK